MHEFFNNKSILITGAASGIGRELAQRLAGPGVRLVLVDIVADRLSLAADDCRGRGALVHTEICDVSEFEQVEAMRGRLAGEFRDIDLLIPNAGVAATSDVAEFSAEKARELMNVNYFGVVHVVSVFMGAMIRRKRGQIVAVSSLAGVRGYSTGAYYGPSKAALVNFMESLRLDLAEHNIRVTCLIPGYVDTHMNDYLKERFHLPFMMPLEEVGRRMVKVIIDGRSESYLNWKVSFMAAIWRRLPNWLYDFFAAMHLLDKKPARESERT